MKNIIKGVLMFIVMALISGCGSRAGESSDNLHKREPRTKKRIYAREVLVENLDYPMLPCAYYSNDKPFYGKDKEYHKLSDREIRMVKAIIGDKQKWQKSGSKCPFLDIKEYFRQYLAYRKDGKTYVLVNLYKYFYIIYENNGILGAIAPSPTIHIISLANDKSRNKYDNVTILLDLSRKRILEVHDI